MGHREEYYKDGKLVKEIDTRVLSEEKEKIISQCRKEVSEKLSSTDWYIIRKSERGKNIPVEIQKERADFLKWLEDLESRINATTTLQELDSVGVLK